MIAKMPHDIQSGLYVYYITLHYCLLVFFTWRWGSVIPLAIRARCYYVARAHYHNYILIYKNLTDIPTRYNCTQ